jgi:CheY-like chemotaxis protein
MATPRHTALLVEDDAETANQVKDLLGVLGIDHIHATTQEAALAVVERGGFCLALLDLQIPRNQHSIMAHVQAGQSVLEAIRERYFEKNTKKRMHWLPVLIMTAFAKETDYVVEMMARGADGYLLKPFGEMTKLADTIRDALERAERDNHYRCEDITTRAQGTPSVPAAGGTTFSTVLRIPGRRDGKRNEVLVGDRCVRLPTAAFVLLLHLVAGRRAGDGWVHKSVMGASDGWKGPSRLRTELNPYLPAGLRADQNDGDGSYRLNSSIEVGDVDWAALASHEDHHVRAIATAVLGQPDRSSALP